MEVLLRAEHRLCRRVQRLAHAALAEALERGEKTLRQSLLELHALSVDRCTQMVTDAVAGEVALTEDDQAAYRLRVRLGLEGGAAEQQEQARRSEPSLRRSQRVWQRNPTGDPVAATVTQS